jgi:tryptophan-rich sensory protein
MLRFVSLIATVIVLAVNACANLIPINGYNTGQLSALYPTGFTPAGWVFSIWSLIYVGLIALSVWAIRVSGPAAERFASIRGAYLVSCAANALWIIVWHYRQILASLIVMLVLLASLALVYLRLRRSQPRTFAERACLDWPVSLYFGWITTATIVNLSAWFFDRGAYPFGLSMDEWALVSVTVAIGTFAAVGVRNRDPIYVAVFAWASLGIVLQRLEISAAVRTAAAAACAVAACAVIALLVERFVNARRATAAAPTR